MNLRLFLHVIVRFKFLVVGGLILALTLATVSLVRIGFDGGLKVEYRSEERWQSTATLFVTQPGFPWGRSVLDEVIPVGPQGEAGYVPRYSDINRFQTLAQLYAEMAMGDAVRAIVSPSNPLELDYDAAPVSSRDGSTNLPLVGIHGFGRSEVEAKTTARRVTEALILYIKQQSARIPEEKRVDLQVIERPREAELVEGRRLTRPIFLFVLVMSAVIALAFILENLRPRRGTPVVEVTAAPMPTRESARRAG